MQAATNASALTPFQILDNFIEKFAPRKTWLADKCGFGRNTIHLYVWLSPKQYPTRKLNERHFEGIAAYASELIGKPISAGEVAADFVTRGGVIGEARR
jgi:hypothetical protein